MGIDYFTILSEICELMSLYIVLQFFHFVAIDRNHGVRIEYIFWTGTEFWQGKSFVPFEFNHENRIKIFILDFYWEIMKQILLTV